jgi:hypothetical protein
MYARSYVCMYVRARLPAAYCLPVLSLLLYWGRGYVLLKFTCIYCSQSTFPYEYYQFPSFKYTVREGVWPIQCTVSSIFVLHGRNVCTGRYRVNNTHVLQISKEGEEISRRCESHR